MAELGVNPPGESGVSRLKRIVDGVQAVDEKCLYETIAFSEYIRKIYVQATDEYPKSVIQRQLEFRIFGKGVPVFQFCIASKIARLKAWSVKHAPSSEEKNLSIYTPHMSTTIPSERWATSMSNRYLVRLFLEAYARHPYAILYHMDPCHVVFDFLPKWDGTDKTTAKAPKEEALEFDCKETINYFNGYISRIDNAGNPIQTGVEFDACYKLPPRDVVEPLLKRIKTRTEGQHELSRWDEMTVGTSVRSTLSDTFLPANISIPLEYRPLVGVFSYGDKNEWKNGRLTTEAIGNLKETSSILHNILLDIVRWNYDEIVTVFDLDGNARGYPRVYTIASLTMLLKRFMLFTSSFLMVVYSIRADVTTIKQRFKVHGFTIGCFYEIFRGWAVRKNRKTLNLHIFHQAANNHLYRQAYWRTMLRHRFHTDILFNPSKPSTTIGSEPASSNSLQSEPSGTQLDDYHPALQPGTLYISANASNLAVSTTSFEDEQKGRIQADFIKRNSQNLVIDKGSNTNFRMAVIKTNVEITDITAPYHRVVDLIHLEDVVSRKSGGTNESTLNVNESDEKFFFLIDVGLDSDSRIKPYTSLADDIPLSYRSLTGSSAFVTKPGGKGLFKALSKSTANLVFGPSSPSWRVIPVGDWIAGRYDLWLDQTTTTPSTSGVIELYNIKHHIDEPVDNNSDINPYAMTRLGSLNIHLLSLILHGLTEKTTTEVDWVTQFITRQGEDSYTDKLPIQTMTLQSHNFIHQNLYCMIGSKVLSTNVFQIKFTDDIRSTLNRKNYKKVTEARTKYLKFIFYGPPLAASYYPLPTSLDNNQSPLNAIDEDSIAVDNLCANSEALQTNDEEVRTMSGITKKLMTLTRAKTGHIPWNFYKNEYADLPKKLSKDAPGVEVQLDLTLKTIALRAQYMRHLETMVMYKPSTHEVDIFRMLQWLSWSSMLMLRMLSALGDEDVMGEVVSYEESTVAVEPPQLPRFTFLANNLKSTISLIGKHPYYEDGSQLTESQIRRWLKVDGTVNPEKPGFDNFIVTWATSKGDIFVDTNRPSSITHQSQSTFTSLVLKVYTLMEYLIQNLDLDIALDVAFGIAGDPLLGDRPPVPNYFNDGTLRTCITAYDLGKTFIEYICFGKVHPRVLTYTQPGENDSSKSGPDGDTNQLTSPEVGGLYYDFSADQFTRTKPPSVPGEPKTREVLSMYRQEWQVVTTQKGSIRKPPHVHIPASYAEVRAMILKNSFKVELGSYFDDPWEAESVTTTTGNTIREKAKNHICKRFRIVPHFITKPDGIFTNVWCFHGHPSDYFNRTNQKRYRSREVCDGLGLLFQLFYWNQNNTFFSPYGYTLPNHVDPRFPFATIRSSTLIHDDTFWFTARAIVGDAAFNQILHQKPISDRKKRIVYQVLFCLVFASFMKCSSTALGEQTWPSFKPEPSKQRSKVGENSMPQWVTQPNSGFASPLGLEFFFGIKRTPTILESKNPRMDEKTGLIPLPTTRGRKIQLPVEEVWIGPSLVINNKITQEENDPSFFRQVKAMKDIQKISAFFSTGTFITSHEHIGKGYATRMVNDIYHNVVYFGAKIQSPTNRSNLMELLKFYQSCEWNEIVSNHEVLNSPFSVVSNLKTAHEAKTLRLLKDCQNSLNRQ